MTKVEESFEVLLIDFSLPRAGGGKWDVDNASFKAAVSKFCSKEHRVPKFQQPPNSDSEEKAIERLTNIRQEDICIRLSDCKFDGTRLLATATPLGPCQEFARQVLSEGRAIFAPRYFAMTTGELAGIIAFDLMNEA